MNKTHFLLVAVAFCFVSCTQKKPSATAESLGKMNAVSVMIDDQLWNGEVGDSLRNKFASPVLGLQEEEPIFTLNQYPGKLLEGFMTNSRNIIVIKKEAKSKFYIKENEYVTPQLAVHISGSSVKELLDSIETNAPKIIKEIKASEIKVFQNQIVKEKLVSDKIKSRFNINLNVPAKYKIVVQGKKFLWLKKEITSGNLSLLLYQVPLHSAKDTLNMVKSTVRWRDSIGRQYIRGSKPRTKMITEPAFSPYLSRTTISGKTAYETKGTWDLKNDFMSGPYINYAFMDTKNKRILILEGFCYAPSKEKRDLMLELEAIIKSVQFFTTSK
ncbi:MAG: DUF4837 family protein [Bacteroidota bacterium]